MYMYILKVILNVLFCYNGMNLISYFCGREWKNQLSIIKVGFDEEQKEQKL